MTDKSNGGSTVLRVEDLRLSYGRNDILRGVSLELVRGEVVSLLGESGSGKTTLLRSVAGLERPDRGRIAVDGQTVFDAQAGVDVPAERRGLGLVFQSYALWPHKNVFDNVAYGLRLRVVGKADIERRVSAVLVTLGLQSLERRYPHQLSGGQQQRVALARALVYNPPVLLLDEPLSNLDAKLREEARAWLRELIISLQLSALLVTHDQAEALAMSDRVLLLNRGLIEQAGTPTQIYDTPQTLFAAGFMGSNNMLPGTIGECRDGSVQVIGRGWSLWGEACGRSEPGAQGTAVIRLEQVRVADGSGVNRIRMQLVTSMCLGDKWEYLFKSQSLIVRARGASPLPAGEYWVEMPANRVWVFP